MTFRQKDRGTGEYDEPCKDCLVLDHIVCPLVEESYKRNIKQHRCDFAKPFGESLVRALTIKYGNPNNKKVS